MSSEHIGIDDARKTLGPIVDRARAGADIVLTRRGQPVARIIPIEEAHMPTMAERITTWRSMATVSNVVDTLGIDDRSPGLMDLARAEVTIEAAPFRALVAGIDAFFGDELDEAFMGAEAAEAEAEARRIVEEHLAQATARLGAANAIPSIDHTNAMALQRLAYVALRRAADLKFVEVVSPAVAVQPAQ